MPTSINKVGRTSSSPMIGSALLSYDWSSALPVPYTLPYHRPHCMIPRAHIGSVLASRPTGSRFDSRSG